MTKTKYLFLSLPRVSKFIMQSPILTLGIIALSLVVNSTAFATHSNKDYFKNNDYPNQTYYNLNTYPSYNLSSSPHKTIQLCQYDQGLQSGHVDHLGQSDLEIYTNEQGDEVMRTVPRSSKDNGERGNTYYISPQIYPMPNAYPPPPNFIPGQKPRPSPKP